MANNAKQLLHSTPGLFLMAAISLNPLQLSADQTLDTQGDAEREVCIELPFRTLCFGPPDSTPQPPETPEASPTPQPTHTPTATAEPTPTATAEPTPTATAEPTPTATAEPTPTATAEPTPTATAEPTPTATAEPTPTATAEPTPTATAEPTPTATAEPTPTATAEPTPTATAEPTPTATPTMAPTPTVAPTPTPTIEPTPTLEPTPRPCGVDQYNWGATIHLVMDATTNSPIFPNIYVNEYIPADIDVEHTWCEADWTIQDEGGVEILGLPVEYEISGGGFYDSTDPNVDLTTDLLITIPQLGCEFAVDGILMTGTQTQSNGYVTTTGDKSLTNLVACGARWNVESTLTIYGFLE